MVDARSSRGQEAGLVAHGAPTRGAEATRTAAYVDAPWRCDIVGCKAMPVLAPAARTGLPGHGRAVEPQR
ncbi:hypothetical protein [Streptomyces rishiriensis]|uniref:Uncharacterized protein n=1 Tax=Streptomyces rishiriensis TaxID=68264 RepID=A0ABU0NFP4_STRRH|nr:hypothetical protein [Streptomyces rishiriensis]MDQ0577926.1 hypothetical protein [Streptomyces rishiriensis]